MSHVLVKPTSGPEVGEVGDPVAGACVGQDLPRPARQRLGLSPDSCACPAPGGLGPCGRTVWFEPPWVTHRPQRCHPALGGSDHLRSVQFRFPHSEAHVLNVSMRGDLDLGDPVDVTGGSTCSS